jgi:hypothetical protein
MQRTATTTVVPEMRITWPEFLLHAARSFDRLYGSTDKSLYALASVGLVVGEPASTIAAIAERFLWLGEDPLDWLDWQIVRLDRADQWQPPADGRWRVLGIVRTYTEWVTYYNDM